MQRAAASGYRADWPGWRTRHRAIDKLLGGRSCCLRGVLRASNQCVPPRHQRVPPHAARAQVLTHVREKLQCVQRQSAAAVGELGALDGALLARRGALAGAKAARLARLARAERLCGSSTAVLDPALRADYLARPGHLCFCTACHT